MTKSWTGRILVIAAIMALHGAAHAEDHGPLTGMELRTMCEANDTPTKALCAAYTGGYTEGYILGQQLLKSGYPPVCPVKGLSAPQMRLIVQKTISDHPELLNEGARVIMAKALTSFWCMPGQLPKYGLDSN